MPYVKVWTSLRRKKWFQKLRCNGRGVVVQLYIFAKDEGDTGRIVRAKMRHLCEDLAIDERTFRKVAAFLQHESQLLVSEDADGAVEVTLTDYLDFQELKEKEYRENERQKAAKMSQKCDKNVGLLEQSRAEQSRAEQAQTNSDPIRFAKLVERLQMDPQLSGIIGAQVPRDFLDRLLVEFGDDRIEVVTADLSRYVGGLKYQPDAEKLRNWFYDRCRTWKGKVNQEDDYKEKAKRRIFGEAV